MVGSSNYGPDYDSMEQTPPPPPPSQIIPPPPPPPPVPASPFGSTRVLNAYEMDTMRMDMSSFVGGGDSTGAVSGSMSLLDQYRNQVNNPTTTGVCLFS